MSGRTNLERLYLNAQVRLLTLTDGNSNVTSYAYDDVGNLSTITYRTPAVRSTPTAGARGTILAASSSRTRSIPRATSSRGRTAGTPQRPGTTPPPTKPTASAAPTIAQAASLPPPTRIPPASALSGATTLTTPPTSASPTATTTPAPGDSSTATPQDIAAASICTNWVGATRSMRLTQADITQQYRLTNRIM